MTRTKVSVKRRQPRRRLKREAKSAQLREVREAEHQQQAQAVAVPQENALEHPVREEDVVEESIREHAREEEEKAPAEQEDNAHEQEAKEQEEEHAEGKGREGGEEEEDEGEEEEEANGGGEEGHLLLTDYEKQRERRLKENAAKLAALNLPALASSFGPSKRPQRQCCKKKSNKDDDYMPSNSSDSEDSDSDDNGEEDAGPSNQQDVDGDYIEDEALQEAIALSLTATTENGIGTRSEVSQTRKGKRQVSSKNDVAKKRRKGRQEQVTTDEIAAVFSVIDEQGNGKFSVAELERIAHSHDFMWSKQEISDMIDFFDTDKDGQLDLSEFQSIFDRMKMLKMHVT